MKIDKKEKAVVVIGSGPGGAQVAYQLTKQGIPVVLLEAGRRIMKEEYVNEEWPAFSQMAWLDKRTMTGNSRIVKDFNGLPTWLVKAVGGTATHWAGATPRFLDYEWKTKSTYGSVDGATLMDWPIDGKEMKPYYVKAENAIGSTHRGGRPPLPANNNYKVFAEGAKRMVTSSMQQGLTVLMQLHMMEDQHQFKMVLISKVIRVVQNGIQT